MNADQWNTKQAKHSNTDTFEFTNIPHTSALDRNVVVSTQTQQLAPHSERAVPYDRSYSCCTPVGLQSHRAPAPRARHPLGLQGGNPAAVKSIL
uniref:Uncharacterized protein n=1 Tax=Eutreptiella gymnastica TaxID=73025 RepID=A0A7S4LDA7_9EUGL